MAKAIQVKPGSKVKLKEIDPDSTEGVKNRDEAEKQLEKDRKRMAELQERLYAENRRSILIVLQAMDTGGKDGTIKNVLSGLNPSGCEITAFKAPSEEERDHDFLWRIYGRVPRRGNIGLFNRSHYEDVLIVRVHNFVPKAEWEARYDIINNFEEILSDTGTKLLKFFLHISKDEQKLRLEERLKDPGKHWKFDTGDIKERERWEDYQEAYEAALTRCNTKHAPWHIIPANKKWYRNLLVARTIVDALEEMDPQCPKSSLDPTAIVIK
ncbi:MAG: polyphosphate kinase 2 family protein [Deltaproteobacteria bacterium]|nr:polyphosphate kinase 2 family protein [Deltaproteobacteria bacterium]